MRLETAMASSSEAARKLPRAQCAKFSRARRFSYESPERLKELEKGFVLDAVALSKHANDETGRTHPSLNLGIPQYNAFKDPHCKTYFKMKGLPVYTSQAKEIKLSEGDVTSELSGSSMMGLVFDQFLRNSSARQYLKERESKGAGYTRQLYGGHLTVPAALPKVGYHGEDGFRRNTPNLRRKRSVFDYEVDMHASQGEVSLTDNLNPLYEAVLNCCVLVHAIDYRHGAVVQEHARSLRNIMLDMIDIAPL